ncbi:unnamed protein product [Meganyctiphanes norvegica]|uniref:Uncharacterized protein n=1 Tax=Meganyctiphanes norvegica TaxID=48144 RepID=A0AAV2RE42_MEGNR
MPSPDKIMSGKKEKLGFPPDPGEIKHNRTGAKPKDNATLIKSRMYGNKTRITQDQKDSTTFKPLHPLKADKLGLDPNRIAQMKDTLKPIIKIHKRKDTSPTEKTPQPNTPNKLARLTYVTDESSSTDSVQMTEEEMKDMWETFSPSKRNNKKYEYLRELFEPKIVTKVTKQQNGQRGQLPRNARR